MDTAAVNAVVGMLTGKKVPDSRLLSGSIGDGAYGAQWRKWEDIRIISVEEVQVFIDKGYKELARFNENVETKIEDRDHDTLEVKGYKTITDVVERVIVQKKIDQLKEVINQINNNENSRRIIMSAWNVGRLDQMQLPPCHSLTQWNVRRGEDGTKYLTCNLYCRKP
jgi:thymidylate synthase